jgi:predicted PurR-regulated permease PerM
MTNKDKFIFFLIAFISFCGFIYLIKSILAPFITSVVIAYFLNPIVNHLHSKFRISRVSATSLILGLFFAVLFTAASLLLPIVYIQLAGFLDSLPQYFSVISANLYPKLSLFLNSLGGVAQEGSSGIMSHEEFTKKIVSFLDGILSNAINSSASLINFLSFIFIIPILVFYMLKDWNIMLSQITNHLPRKIIPTVRTIAHDVDKTLMGFVRGQFNVCLTLGLIYSFLLSLVGLNFGFLIGLLTGLFSFVPYLGMLTGVVVAVILALFQWGFDIGNISLVLLVFAFGQIIESNFLTPKLIGSKIGLHPAWLIFGLFVFGAIFGVMGVIMAVPLTAICGVIVKHFAHEYIKRFV